MWARSLPLRSSAATACTERWCHTMATGTWCGSRWGTAATKVCQ
ncbi:MAG: hypothetical protein IIZ23_02185, partial [Ruminococcus sp.]|nr:hypothetical protein [Ruminococcus sp.]